MNDKIVISTISANIGWIQNSSDLSSEFVSPDICKYCANNWKYCNVLIHCDCLGDGMLGAELTQKYSQ